MIRRQVIFLDRIDRKDEARDGGAHGCRPGRSGGLQRFGGGIDIVGIARRTPGNDVAPAFAQLAALL